MKRFAILPLLALVLSACSEVNDVLAPDDTRPQFASASFTTGGAKAPTATLLANGDLRVSFKITGLGSNVNVDVTGHADVEVVESCVNGGSNIPNDAKKTTTSTSVDHTEQFQSGKNGSVEDSIDIPRPSGSLSCPAGQVATLISVVWSNVSISFLSEFGQSGQYSFGGATFGGVLWP